MLATFMAQDRKDRGQSLVEFAMVVPILVVLLMAIVECGRAWMVKQNLTCASREGARVAILPSTDEDDVRNAVNQQLAAAGLDQNATITMTNVGLEGTAGDEVRVTVQYPFQVLAGSIIPGFSGTVVLSSTTVMRHE